MIITKKTLSRRTVLRGIGASVALPLLDGMVPAFAAVQNSAARPAPIRGGLRAERDVDGHVDARDRRGGIRVLTDPRVAGAVS